MSIINISVVVDANYVVQHYGTNNAWQSPPAFYHENIYLTVRGSAAVQQNASGWLVMQAKEEGETDVDILRWRMQEISLGADSQCFITKFNIQAGASLITAPKQRRLGSGANSRPDRLWESTVLTRGHVQYNLEFMVVNRQGHVQGYYTYDPAIEISQ